jgi:acetylornithine deacetylase
MTGWLTKIIEKIHAGDPTFKADIQDTRTSDALEVPENSEIIQLTKSILHTEPIGVPYYTEAVSYLKSGIPTIICGPGDIDQAHSLDEYITLEQLDAGTKFFRQIIKRTCLT